MNALKLASRKLFRKGEHTTTRIISLAAGLAFGILLLSEVFYYYSFDSFYPDSNRIYIVNESFNQDKQSEEMRTHSRVSGAIGPGMKAEVPGVEVATRLVSQGNMVFYSEDNKSYIADFSLADEFLFDVLPRPMLSGEGTETLQSPMSCIVSSEIAEKMGGNVVGKTIEIKEYPGKKLTIGGVFKALPENSNYTYDIAISMVSIGNFTWDGTQNWMGNDRYYTCVKLEKGVTPESLAPAVRKMQEKHQNIEDLEAKGSRLEYSFESIREAFPNAVKDMIFILSAIAFIVLFVSVMNYMLLTISTLVNRAKTSAIYKCYGAEKRNLQGIIFTESTLIFFISLVVAFGLILILKPAAEVQVGHSLNATLNSHVVIPVLLILGLLIVSIGYFPGRIFAQTPVAAAFRTYRQNNTKWKKVLLAIQFTGAALILAMLFVVSMQYEKIKNADHGYNSENVYFGAVSGIEPYKIQTVLNELIALPEVEIAGLGVNVPTSSASGNNVFSPDGEKVLFNLNDLYYIDDAYFSVLNIPVTAGKAFKEGESSFGDVMMSQKGADLLAINNGWNDGIVGRNIEISEHNQDGVTSRISGVFPDIVVGSHNNKNIRPTAFFYLPHEQFVKTYEQHPSFGFLILIKTRQGDNANVIKKFTNIFNNAMPRGEAEIKSLATVQENAYQAQKGFRNAIYAGSLVVLLVTIMGLLGYLNDEIARFRKSMAIRKINGATISDIVKIFVFGIGKIAVPCVIFGLVGAWFLAAKWMQNFTVQIALHWWIFVLAGVAILILTGTVAVLNSLKAAHQNPVKSLRYE
ncbi:MAG: ABC transporter permease [Bacteroidia bacterium]|nr:ABC transporter permease [Bacteroidia bacterium]